MFSGIMRFLSGLISLYIFLIFIRIILTWFRGHNLGRPMELLASVTDPYLNFFRSFKIFKIGHFDFSPIVGIILLSVLNNIISSLATYGTITVGIIFALLVSAIWSGISFFILIFFILVILRLLKNVSNKRSTTTFWDTIDFLLRPTSEKISTYLFKERSISYNGQLAVFAGILAFFWFFGGFLIRRLVIVLQQLPF
jgi:YggT family protein